MGQICALDTKTEENNFVSKRDFSKHETYHQVESETSNFLVDKRVDTKWSNLIYRIFTADQGHILDGIQESDLDDSKNMILNNLSNIDFENFDAVVLFI